MTKAELDYILGAMLDTHPSVSDLNITADKPLQVEVSGELTQVAFDPPIEKLTPFQTETIALQLIDGNRRLTEELIKSGSCVTQSAVNEMNPAMIPAATADFLSQYHATTKIGPA